MDSNEETIQKRVVINGAGKRSEVSTETSHRDRSPTGISAGTVAVIAILAVMVVAGVIIVVSNQNTNEAANRNANLAAGGQLPTPVQQPAPVQQAPIIIQQPAAVQPAPVIIQQSAPDQKELTRANEDANLQDIATKKLSEDLELGSVVAKVDDARAVLSGAVGSAAAKARAEQLVKAVPGVKSVENNIVVPD
jgi:hypothetical protein